MEDLKNNKLLWFIGVMFIINMFGFVGTKVMVEKAAQRAVEMLERDYSPAKPPYGPGLNPDKIDLRRQSPDTYDQQWKDSGPSYYRDPNPASWRYNWENSRR